MEKTKESQVLDIIDAMVTTGSKTLDEVKMNELKNIIRKNKKLMDYVYYALMTQLKRKHSEIRYSTLLIINEIYQRSKHFRGLLQDEMRDFFELTMETNKSMPLPKPKERAKDLKLKALEFFKEWHTDFAEENTALHYAFQHIERIKEEDLREMERLTARRRIVEQRRQEKLDKIIAEDVAKVQSEMKKYSEELSVTIQQMESCFELLIPNASNDLFSREDFEMDSAMPCSSIENNDMANISLRQHGICDMKETITIEVKDKTEIIKNEDTLPILENLNDFYRIVTNKYYPMVTNWLKTLTKGTDCLVDLKKAIDLKQRMESAFKKYKDIDIKSSVPTFDDDDDDDEEDLVEVEDKEDYEEKVKNTKITYPASQPGSSKTPTVAEKAYMWNFKHSENDVKDPTSALSTITKIVKKLKPSPEDLPITEDPSSDKKDYKSTSKKEELLSKAPVLPYDIDLYHWEEEKPLIPEVVRFDSLHKFWEAPSDINESEEIKAAQIASLRTRKIDFSGKFEPVKWACRAPLPSGKLCPRKDRYKCPLHGKIIPRDASGKPDNAQDTAGPSTSQNAVPDWQDPELLKDIETATGVNLKVPEKRGKKKERSKNGLTNINIEKTTVKERLEKKLEKRHKFWAQRSDEADRKKFDDKFGDQWNYY